MPIAASKINPCLWFDTEAEEAARFYCSIFKNSKVGTISRYGSEGKEIHGKEAGSVMAVEFELDGERFAALNGQRGDLVSDPLRRPERSRLFLGEADR
jgi:predicted 3-demethylubiquinone-9 3-methyltransferase (glyoxalase superfamily)